MKFLASQRDVGVPTLAPNPGWTLSSVLDYFIPKTMMIDAEQHRRARMFMLSHAFGPVLGNSLPAYLFIFNIVRDYRVTVFFLSITAFWIYPFLLRMTGWYRAISLISIQNLAFCVLWACYAFGGLLSPFIPWLLIVPLLSFLYLPSVGWTRDVLLVQIVGNVGILLFMGSGAVDLPPVDLEDFQVIGMISMGAVAIYFAMMALYFAKMYTEQREFTRELNNLVTSSDNMRDLTAAAEQASAAKAHFIASMSHELRTPLNAIIGYSQLLLEEAVDEGDSAGGEDLKKIYSAGSSLLYLIDHILDYSRIEAGRMPVNPRPDKLASLLPHWRAECLKNSPSIELEAQPDADLDIVLLTDWTALGAVVRNVVASIAANGADGSVALGFTVHPDGRYALTFTHRARSGDEQPISLSHEVFDSSQDVSPTNYGSMGIESGLALKFVQLLEGHFEEPSAARGCGLHIEFPAIAASRTRELAA